MACTNVYHDAVNCPAAGLPYILWCGNCTVEYQKPLPKCLDAGKGNCSGKVEYRMPLSVTGKSFPRCEKHWSDRLEEQDRINQRYPQTPPSDFSPLDAGESWDDE